MARLIRRKCAPLRFAIVEAFLTERAKQDSKWGTSGHDDGTWSRILGEEVGEYNNASLREEFDRKNREGHRNKDKIYEAIQVMAVAGAIVEDAAHRRRWTPKDIRKMYVNGIKNGKHKNGKK